MCCNFESVFHPFIIINKGSYTYLCWHCWQGWIDHKIALWSVLITVIRNLNAFHGSVYWTDHINFQLIEREFEMQRNVAVVGDPELPKAIKSIGNQAEIES